MKFFFYFSNMLTKILAGIFLDLPNQGELNQILKQRAVEEPLQLLHLCGSQMLTMGLIFGRLI